MGKGTRDCVWLQAGTVRGSTQARSSQGSAARCASRPGQSVQTAWRGEEAKRFPPPTARPKPPPTMLGAPSRVSRGTRGKCDWRDRLCSSNWSSLSIEAWRMCEGGGGVFAVPGSFNDIVLFLMIEEAGGGRVGSGEAETLCKLRPFLRSSGAIYKTVSLIGFPEDQPSHQATACLQTSPCGGLVVERLALCSAQSLVPFPFHLALLPGSSRRDTGSPGHSSSQQLWMRA